MKVSMKCALVIWIRPETKRFNHEQAEDTCIGGLHPCLLQKTGMIYGWEWKTTRFWW